MTNIKNALIERKQNLERIIEYTGKRLDGENIKESVHAHKHGVGYQYYKKDEYGISYVKSADMKWVMKAVQQEYDIKVLKNAEKENKRIASLISLYGEGVIEDIYSSMPAGKRKLIEPVMVPDEEYLENWLNQTYEQMGFREDAPEYYSLKGERMRSKSEVIIANMLDKLNIAYKYEKPLTLKSIGVVHPDFTILDVRNRKEIYWEHLGMLDDQGYRNNAIVKIRDYENSGYYIGDRLLITEESVNYPLDVKCVERRVKHILGM